MKYISRKDAKEQRRQGQTKKQSVGLLLSVLGVFALRNHFDPQFRNSPEIGFTSMEWNVLA